MLRNTRCDSVEKASRACEQSALPARVIVAKWRLIRRPFCSLQLHIPRKKKKISIRHTCLQAVVIAKDALPKHFFIKSLADCSEITAHAAPQTTPQNRPGKPLLSMTIAFFNLLSTTDNSLNVQRQVMEKCLSFKSVSTLYKFKSSSQ